MRRGAPLTVGQLWQGYGELQRRKQEQQEGFLDRLFEQGRFRQLEELAWDPWLGGESRLGGQLRDAKPMNATERLLVQWSRRVKITFVGVYDTVGAMGLDALAIPGLRGRAGRLHNMRPSSIIGDFRHALAIDEYRSSFEHTPLVEYLSHAKPGRAAQGLPAALVRRLPFRTSAAATATTAWPSFHSPGCWRRRGRWASRPSCRRPGRLLSARPSGRAARAARLVRRVRLAGGALRAAHQAQFSPDPAARRAAGQAGEAGKPQATLPAAGFSLHSAETIDDSVWAYAAERPSYAPPNLVEYAGRVTGQTRHPEPRVKEVAGRAIASDWPSRLGGGYPWLAIWMLLAGFGAMVMDGVFLLFPGSAGPRDWVAAAVVVVVAGLVDWGESRLKLKVAAGSGTFWHRALADALFWTRSLLVILFVAGALGVLSFLATAGWNSGPRTLGDAFRRVFEVAGEGWLLAPLAVLVLVLATLLDDELGEIKPGERHPPPRLAWWRRVLGGGGWLVLVAAVVVGLVFLGRSAWNIAEQAGFSPRPIFAFRLGQPPADAVAAGRYLFLVVALAYLARAFEWVGEPMARANLGSIVALMFKLSGRGIERVLLRWQQLLECPWTTDDEVRDGDTAEGREGRRREKCAETARCAVRAAVRQGIWRDILGFIPAYGIILGYGLYFASGLPGWSWIVHPWPLWWIIPLATVVADWFETISQLSYVGKNRTFRSPRHPPRAGGLRGDLGEVRRFQPGAGDQRHRALLGRPAHGAVGGRHRRLAGAIAATLILTVIGMLLAGGFAALKARRDAGW